MDLTAAITPKSDQLNAEDLLTGPRTFTITGVDEGSIEQPVNVHLAEMPGRPWRPSKSMSRVLAYTWGSETTPYAGRRVTLYRDPEVTFGRDKVGGIKISHLSHIDGPKSVSLTVTRGKRKPHEVQPLPDAPAQVAPDPLAVAKSNLWAAWTNGHDADPTALTAAYADYTGRELADATPADLDAFTATLIEPGEQG